MSKFYGRQFYLDDLASLWRKKTSSLVACRGRRRVGFVAKKAFQSGAGAAAKPTKPLPIEISV